MTYNQTICSGPVKKDNDGQLTKGFHFSIMEVWESENVDGETGEVYFSVQTESEGWEIYPNGKFRYENCCNTNRMYETGTFESSKYEEFVNQMKEYKTDWMKELSYDEETEYYSYG